MIPNATGLVNGAHRHEHPLPTDPYMAGDEGVQSSVEIGTQAHGISAVLSCVSNKESSAQLKAGEQIVDHIRLFAPHGVDSSGGVWDAIHAYEGRVAVKVFTTADAQSVGCETIEQGTTSSGFGYVVAALDDADAMLQVEAPVDEVSYDHLHDMQTCRPPLKRNWFPVFAAAAVAAVGALVVSGVF